MGPPSYKALSVEHAPWSHTQRHPGSPAAPHAPTHIAARSMPTIGANRQRDCTHRSQCAHSSHARAASRQARIGHARTPHTAQPPSTPPRNQGVCPAISTTRRPALGRSAHSDTPSPRQPPHTPAPGGHPTTRSPRHESHTAWCGTPATRQPHAGVPRTCERHTHNNAQVGTFAQRVSMLFLREHIRCDGPWSVQRPTRRRGVLLAMLSRCLSPVHALIQ